MIWGWRRLRNVVHALAWAALLSSAASAQSSVAAEALFRAGRKATAQGDHATACAKYRESYRIERALGTLLNIAVCEEALGQLASAWQRYQELVHALDPSDTRAAIVRTRLPALEQRVPFITVHLADGAPEGTQVEIGAMQLSAASFGVALPWDVGTHELRVLAPGHAPRVYPFALVEGERRTLDVDIGEPVPEPVAEPEQPAITPFVAPMEPPLAAPAPMQVRTSRQAPREDHATERVLSYGALGLGAGALVLSGVSFGAALDRKGVFDDHCPNDECDRTGIGAASAGRTWLTVSWVSLAVGAVSAALGAYGLWATDDDGAQSAASLVVEGSGVRVSF
jgi:tetratricopeptide (TPR) repeat protein